VIDHALLTLIVLSAGAAFAAVAGGLAWCCLE
jgi:hypothetical protein